MSDLDLRAAERRWLESGDPRDGAALLLARLRRGELTDPAIHVAAALGEERARLLRPDVPLVDWTDYDQRRDAIRDAARAASGRRAGSTAWRRVVVAFAVDCAERTLPSFERERPGDNRPRRALEAARAWVAAPTDVNLEAAWAAAWVAWWAGAAKSAWAAAEAAAGWVAADAAGATARAAEAAEAAAEAAGTAGAAEAAGQATGAAGAAEAAWVAVEAAAMAEREWQRLRLAAYALREVVP